MKRVLFMAFVCLIAILFLSTGCSSNVNDANKNSSPQNNVTEADAAEEYDDIVIETTYGNLYFPGKWRECLQVEQSNIESVVEVAFSAKVDTHIISLFSIVIGDNGDSAAGILTDNAGTQRNVTVKIEDLSENESISQDDLELLYSIQEDLNYLIDNLK